MRIKIATVLLAVLWLFVGCAGHTPKAQLRTAYDTYAETVSILADLVNAGYFTPEQAQEVERYRLVARLALDGWKEAVDNGESPGMAIDRFNDALRELMFSRTLGERKRDGRF